ncbi:NmrA family NAD(P)-binding protein [Variovorax sp. V15]|uniref:NmrA family NAD(P)-binding protein n=1 Tax=Variovorax sp. V15 TaxID=3065952 RepID=UPI0034E8CB9D
MPTTRKTSTYAVVGATSDVGKAVVGGLQAAGHHVRPVSRSAGVSLDDAAALRQVFAGVDGAFLMVPFDLQAADLHAREREIGANLARAVKEASVRRVVLLSGLSAHLRKGSSLGAALLEQGLDELHIPELVHLRAGFFMENFRKGLDFASQAGIGFFGTMFRGDLPMPMVSAADVGDRAVRLLTDEAATLTRVHELHGGGDYTMAQATAILGAAIGKPKVQYVQVPHQDALASMLGAGMSPSFAEAVLETARSFNEQEGWALEARSPRNTSSTTLEQWAKAILAEGERA